MGYQNRLSVMLERRSAKYALGAIALSTGLALTMNVWAAASCPIELGAIEDAKPNKLYLYFPTADDAAFPATTCTLGTASCFPSSPGLVRPLRAFDLSNLSSYTGTVGDLRDMIRDVVIDDYCELNVKVIETTSVPPTTFGRRVTIGIGTDSASLSGGNLFGEAQEVDIGDALGVDFARVWGGSYQVEAGGSGGALNGVNSTLQRWAFSIGGSTAHEAGHTYGLTHANGQTVLAGEDPLNTHIMPAGSTLTDEDRAGARRHFDDTSFGILAANVGLSVETIHNWDFVNPNGVDAHQIQFELLTSAPTLTLSWSYGGNLTPWASPSVSGPVGTTSFRGTTYNRFRVTWATGQAWANGPAGIVPAGIGFHVGAAFSGVDFTVPDPVIVAKVTLLDGGGTALTLQPRMAGYDAGALDVADGAYRVNFFTIDNPARPLILSNLQVSELPRVASIDSMVRGATLASWQGLPIRPWKEPIVLCEKQSTTRDGRCARELGEESHPVTVSALKQGRHIAQIYDGKCPPVTPPSGTQDATVSPDVNECPTAGISLDLFPSTTIYLTATIVDPAAKHWDPGKGEFVVGPLESHVYYQIAGRHPDFNRNGIDDFIDIKKGPSKDANGDGVPDEVQRHAKEWHALEACELHEHNLQLELYDVERQEHVKGTSRKIRHGLEEREHELDERLDRQQDQCLKEFHEFQQLVKKHTPNVE